MNPDTFGAPYPEDPRTCPELYHHPMAAWPRGQEEDLVCPLAAGGRIHAQRYGEIWRYHLDKHDPDAGIWHALLHLLLETPMGPVFGALGVGLLLWVLG